MDRTGIGPGSWLNLLNWSVRSGCNLWSTLLPFILNILFCCFKSIGHAADLTNTERLNKLAAFQRKVLTHALSCKFQSKFTSLLSSSPKLDNSDTTYTLPKKCLTVRCL